MSTGVADHQVRRMRDVMFYYRDFDISNIRFFNCLFMTSTIKDSTSITVFVLCIMVSSNYDDF
jgi:hypothetical protein